MKTPTSATSTSSSGKVSQPSACRSGIDASSGTRARSETTIVRRAPSARRPCPTGSRARAIGHELGGEDDAHLRRRARGLRARTTAARGTSSASRARRRSRPRRARRSAAAGAGATAWSVVRSARRRRAGRPRRRARSASRAARRSLTMSQWMRETLLPPRSGKPLPSATWTVPSIFSSNSVFRM